MNLLNGKLHKFPKPNASAPVPNGNTQPVQEPRPPGLFPKMPIRRIMPGMTVITMIPMEQVPNGSKQNYPMPLGFMTSMGICGNGSRIFPVTITVLMQTESPSKGPLEGEYRVTRGGHYSQSRKYMRSSHHEPKTETSKYVGVGIRLCADP